MTEQAVVAQPDILSPILAIRDLDARYGKSHVVQQASLSVAQECVALMGRNGVGKTALVRAVMGIVPPQASGAVDFCGQNILGLPSWRISRLGIGYVPQGRRLFDALTVKEHLRLTRRRGSPADQWTVERVYALFPALAARQHACANRLSGGERSMLAIGRALMTQPVCLILDEPTEGLAPAVVERVASKLAELAAQGVAVLLVEQNLLPVQIAARRVYLMNAGRITGRADPQVLAADRQALNRFLGLSSTGQDQDIALERPGC